MIILKITEKELRDHLLSHRGARCNATNRVGMFPRYLLEHSEQVGKEAAKASGRFFRVSANVIRFRPFGKTLV